MEIVFRNVDNPMEEDTDESTEYALYFKPKNGHPRGLILEHVKSGDLIGILPQEEFEQYKELFQDPMTLEDLTIRVEEKLHYEPAYRFNHLNFTS